MMGMPNPFARTSPFFLSQILWRLHSLDVTHSGCRHGLVCHVALNLKPPIGTSDVVGFAVLFLTLKKKPFKYGTNDDTNIPFQ